MTVRKPRFFRSLSLQVAFEGCRRLTCLADLSERTTCMSEKGEVVRGMSPQTSPFFANIMEEYGKIRLKPMRFFQSLRKYGRKIAANYES